jgi:hypothetical protein
MVLSLTFRNREALDPYVERRVAERPVSRALLVFLSVT